jgi:uncharacterized protein DUF1549/uncharacterized protein DUF1553/F5/8 type C domain-containing protein/cytochrome c
MDRHSLHRKVHPGAIGLCALVLTAGVSAAAVRGETARGARALPEQAAGVLARRCLSCHNGEKKAGGIDLTTRAGAEAARVTGPDDPARNRLVRAVSEGKMPPTGRLPAAEIGLLRAWIRAGAVYPQERLEAMKLPDQPLWSLQPVRRPPPPRTRFNSLAKNPIDRFIFARLAAAGLRPSPPASRLALLRRVTVDLTGLPPAPEEVSAFLADRSPDAYEKVVDRLLASPAYGERWAQHWLDVVRYGESNGYEQNHLRPNAWPYRDYVIRAFNEDRPYDRFIAEQLAGDVLGKGDPRIEVATGFLVAGVHDTVGNQTEEGTRQQRSNDLDDIVSATAETFMGLTAGCARCHDHKFDPIPQKDFYRLAAVFAGVRHAERPLAPAGMDENSQKETAEILRRVRSLSGQISDLDAGARIAVLRAEGVQPAPRPAVSARRNVEDFAPAAARFLRFTVLATRNGTEPCLDELEAYSPGEDRNLALAAEGARATASSLLPGYPIHQIAHLNDGRYGNDWSWISSERGGGWAQIEFPQVATVSRVVWSRDSGDRPRFADRLPAAYRVEVSLDGRTWKTVATGEDRATAGEAIPLKTLLQALTPAQKERRGALVEAVEELRRKLTPPAAATTAYIGQFTPPDPVFILKRGDVMQRGEEVSPGALSRIPGISGETGWTPGQGEPERRLGLARWLADPKNPLTARVMVNRLWHYHFGRGIVGTPSDFGHNGEKPTHPELLNWLAVELMNGGKGEWGNGSERAPLPHSAPKGAPWSIKKMHRLMVTSYTYRQSSAVSNPQSAIRNR